jgi:outer membrane lipoprotein SlyB
MMSKAALLLTCLLVAATTTAACTARHRIAPGRPLPQDRTDHVKGALQGTGIGLLAGAAIGGIVGYSAGDDPECSGEDWFCFSFTAKEKATFGAVYVGLPAAAVGLVAGAIIGQRDVYEYEEVPVITTTVSGDRVTANASWSF